MRFLLPLFCLSLLAACGVPGAPSHPEEVQSYSARMNQDTGLGF